MNGIKFSMDMGVSPLRIFNTKRKKSQFVNNDSDTELSTKNIQETDHSPNISHEIKRDIAIFDRRKHKRLSLLDYLLMSESHIHYEEFPYNSFGKKIQENQTKKLHNTKELLEKSQTQLLSKFYFASLLLDTSEDIISYERRYRDGDNLNKNEKLLYNLQDNSKHVKQLFNNNNSTDTDSRYVKKQETYKQTIQDIFTMQRNFENVFANKEFEEEYFHYLEKQKEFVQKNNYANRNQSNFSSAQLFLTKDKIIH
ncbi:MAG TPA: hypothetical protein ENK66_07470 [Arcobacter sp.]|jgi:hypothetical protein|nr:hypothetical protein [Arcobacter sp.]